MTRKKKHFYISKEAELPVVILTIFLDLISCRDQGLGNRDQVSENRQQGTGIRDQGSRIREQGSGNRDQESGNRKL